jgi:hypothetical protein
MMDEIFDRNYQAARADLNAGLDRTFARIGRALGDSFQALHRIQWDAPWTHEKRDIGHA